MRIAVDAMGGDHAPKEIIRGAVEGLQFLGEDDQIVLIGRESVIDAHLPPDANVRRRIVIHNATEVIEMDDAPVEALKKKRDSSIAVMVQLAAEKKVNGVISAGNTGACAAACQLRMRTLAGVQRPGIAVVMPSFVGPLTICDVGANVAPKPSHLVQYAQMASAYAESILGVNNPRVGLLSIGEEDAKGNDLVKQTRLLLREAPGINFIGNVEGRELFSGACEVAICDGFVGNVVLKLTEGLADGLFRTIQREIAAIAPHLVAHFEPVVKAIWAKHDYSEYGGAPLLGVDGLCIICHGSSNHRAIKNAVRVAAEFVRRELNARIAARLEEVPASA